MSSASHGRNRRAPRGFPFHGAAALTLTAIYFVAGKLGLTLAFVHASATAVWPPTGIALAAVMLFGYRVWPCILMGAFLVNVTGAGSPATSMGIAIGNTLEAVFGGYLVNGFCGGRQAFDRPQHLYRFALLAGLMSTALSATFGVTSLSVGGFAAWESYGSIWLTWWLGDAVGDIIVAPLIVLWGVNPRLRWTREQALEALLLLLTLFVVGLIVFGGMIPSKSKSYPLEFLCIPVLLWAAFRFGQREAATSAFCLSGIAIWGTLRGFGPFFRDSQNESLLLLQAFMAVVTLMAIGLGSVVSERKGVEEALRRSRDELEQRVQERTESLSMTVEALQHSERRTRLVIDAAHEAYVAIDAEGRIADWNPEAEVTFGWRRGEALGRPLAETIIPPQYRDAHREGLKRFHATGQGPVLNRRIEVTALHRGGHEFPVELTISPVPWGPSVFFSAFIRDISERKEAERALALRTQQLAASNEELEAFSYSASHDLRAPLRAIDGFSQALLEDCAEGLDDQGRSHLQRIRTAAQHMAQLIDDLLNLAGVSRAEMRRDSVDLSCIARAVAEALQRSDPHRRVEFVIANGLVATGDPRLLRVALENLLANAWKFTGKRERARIEFGVTERDGGRVYFVADNGAGFDMACAGKLFGPFQRLHSSAEFGGTGVGLATVKRIVQRHSGRVWAEGQVGQGATFFFTL